MRERYLTPRRPGEIKEVPYGNKSQCQVDAEAVLEPGPLFVADL